MSYLFEAMKEEEKKKFLTNMTRCHKCGRKGNKADYHRARIYFEPMRRYFCYTCYHNLKVRKVLFR